MFPCMLLSDQIMRFVIHNFCILHISCQLFLLSDMKMKLIFVERCVFCSCEWCYLTIFSFIFLLKLYFHILRREVCVHACSFPCWENLAHTFLFFCCVKYVFILWDIKYSMIKFSSYTNCIHIQSQILWFQRQKVWIFSLK